MLSPTVSTAASARLFPACTSSRSFGQNRPQAVLCNKNSRRFGSCKSLVKTFEGSNLSKSRRRTASAPATNVTDLPLVSTAMPHLQCPTAVCLHFATNSRAKTSGTGRQCQLQLCSNTCRSGSWCVQIQSEEDLTHALTQNKGGHNAM